MGQCQTCKFWGYANGDDRVLGFGSCRRIVGRDIDSWLDISAPDILDLRTTQDIDAITANRKELALLQSADDNRRVVMITKADFGCILYNKNGFNDLTKGYTENAGWDGIK